MQVALKPALGLAVILTVAGPAIAAPKSDNPSLTATHNGGSNATGHTERPDCIIIMKSNDGSPPSIMEPHIEGPGQKAEPFNFLDAATGTKFQVHSDGRHLTAIDRNGEILWTRNPFVDARLCPYRNARPIIIKIATPWANAIKDGRSITREEGDAIAGEAFKRKSRFIEIFFDSSQFGFIDEANGDFFFEGQN